MLIAGGVAWGVGILQRGYDYDEVQRAHSIWMTSQGLRPYHDFFECHPPYFALLAPLPRWFKDPGQLLLALRLTAAAGNVLFLFALATVAAGLAPGGRLAGRLATALVAFHPAVLEFLVEFRIDGWGYALALWSVVRFLRSDGTRRHAELGFLTGIATLLFCPKTALLPPLIVAVEQATARDPRAAARAFATYAGGFAVAGAAVCAYLGLSGIGIDQAFFFVARYNALSNLHSAFHHGLLGQVVESPLLALLLLGGAFAYAWRRIRERSLPGPYDGALAVWLAAQALLVSYPYKQYYGPWLLLASGSLAFLGPALESLSGRIRSAVLVGAGVLSISTSMASAYAWAVAGTARDEVALMRFMERVVGPDDRIVATPTVHPIDRRDTFYVWFNTLDPGGYDTERILEENPTRSGLVSDERYREELAAHPPALVVLKSATGWVLYPRRQVEVLDAFVIERDYRVLAFRGVQFAVRPDRCERFIKVRSEN